jgi:ubiquinone/menaquinone biosynthesis C-methylase UbiE
MQSSISSSAKNRQEAWKSYWASGNLHSCVTSYDGNYSGAIAAFWANAFSGLAAQSRVLDLATGNGAIPKLLDDLKGADILVDAVDATQIAPRWHVSAEQSHIRFHSGVWMEHLPFADVSFDCVCSQFGIEYAERPAAWQETLRVLKQDGRLYCVVHHADSLVTKIAAQERTHCEWLAGNEGLLQAALQLAPWWLQRRREPEAQPNNEAELARLEYNRVQARLAERIEQGGTVDLLLQAREQVQAILTKAKNPVLALQDYRRQLQEAELRCSELVQCAMTRDGMAELAYWLGRQRMEKSLRIEELRQAEGLIAWGLSLTDA